MSGWKIERPRYLRSFASSVVCTVQKHLRYAPSARAKAWRSSLPRCVVREISSCPSGISSVKLSRSASTARFIDRRHQIPCSGTSIFRLRSCWLRPLADCRETCTCCFLMQHLRAKREQYTKTYYISTD